MGRAMGTYRHAVQASTPQGTTCTVLVRAEGGVQLLWHAATATTAVLDPDQAREIAEALVTAAGQHQQPDAPAGEEGIPRPRSR